MARTANRSFVFPKSSAKCSPRTTNGSGAGRIIVVGVAGTLRTSLSPQVSVFGPYRKTTAAVPDEDVVPLNTVFGIATRQARDAAALAALFNAHWLTLSPASRRIRRAAARFQCACHPRFAHPRRLPSGQLALLGARREPADDLIADAGPGSPAALAAHSL
jgi:hypothetical protein